MGGAVSDQDAVSREVERREKGRTARNGARWFWAIAALSLINTAAYWAQLGWTFFVGLGVTQFLDGYGQALGGSWGFAAIAVDVVVAAALVVIGALAQHSRAAYVTGMALYALDTLFLIVLSAWPEAVFHAVVLVFLRTGYLALCSSGEGVASDDSAIVTPATRPLSALESDVGAFDDID
jgi:hypothetical protein